MIKREKILEDFQDRLDAFAGVAGVNCVWKISKFLLPDPDLARHFSQHICDFCLAVKAEEGGEERCVHHDTCEVASAVIRMKEPFVSTCHAGVQEVIVPLPRSSPELAGALFLGPFRPLGGECPESSSLPLWEKLPVLQESAVKGFFEFVPQLFDEIVERVYAEGAGILSKRPRDRRIIDALEYLRSDSLKPTIAKAAERTFMSTSRFSHLFKQECGIGVGDYLRKLRLNRARRFLLGTDWPIGVVAESSGFRDQSHFTLMFRREFGLPPLHYRKKYGRPLHSA